jgi:hypothetical protein
MATPGNTFVKVTAPDPEAVTVRIRQHGADTLGEVEGPASRPQDRSSPISFGQDGSLEAHQALALGCQLANELGRAVVVIDDGGHWRPAWGRLEPA